MFIDVGFVTDRDAEDSVVQRWNEYDRADATSWDMKYSCEMEMKAHVPRQITGAPRVLELRRMMKKKKEKDKDNDDGELQVHYLDLSHVPVDFWTFQSDKISRKRIWMMYEDEERVERDVDSGLRTIRFKIVLVHWRNRRIARLISTTLISVIVYFASRETTNRDPVRSSEIRDEKNVFLRKDDRVIWYQTSTICKSIRVEIVDEVIQ